MAAEAVENSQSDKIRRIGSISAALLLLPLAILVSWRLTQALFYAPINMDAGCFLSICERMIEGWVPFRDLKFGYTPLGLFIMYWSRWFFFGVDESYQVYLGTVLFFQIATAAVIYRISGLFRASRPIGVLIALLFLAGCQVHEGLMIFLEPFVTFFSCCAIYLFLRTDFSDRSRRAGETAGHLFLCGICAGCAFLSKQYGVCVLVPLGVGAIVTSSNSKDQLVDLGWIAAGFITPLSLMLGYYGGVYELDAVEIIKQFWIPGYVKQISGLTWLKQFFIYRNLYLLAVPLLFLVRQIRTDRVFLVIFAAFAAFVVPAAARDFGHYIVLCMPYAVLLGGYLFTILQRAASPLIRPLSLAVLGSLLPMAQDCLEMPEIQSSPSLRDHQYMDAAKIHRVLPPRSPVLLFAEPWLNFAGEFYPVGHWTGTYGFLSNRSVPELQDAIFGSCSIVVDRSSSNYFLPERTRLDKEGLDFDALLRDSGHRLVETIDGHYELWLRSCG